LTFFLSAKQHLEDVAFSALRSSTMRICWGKLPTTAALRRDRKNDGLLRSDPGDLRKRSPMQQIWRDHMLCGIVRATDGYDDALFVILYPARQRPLRPSIQSIQGLAQLRRTPSRRWTLEEVLGRLLADGPRGGRSRFRAVLATSRGSNGHWRKGRLPNKPL